MRYAGAPLHYSFGEADKPRGSWLVDLDAVGLAAVEWLDLPVPRRLKTLRGSLDELLTDPRFDRSTKTRGSARSTPMRRPQLDPMRRLQARFAFCATVMHTPEGLRGPRRPDATPVACAPRAAMPSSSTRSSRTSATGEGASEREAELIRDVIDERSLVEATRVRLHRLELEGFGPFRERQVVDFDAFAADGIFLIAGRTGAGKSSVLDGVCFALYGGVPRYDGGREAPAQRPLRAR